MQICVINSKIAMYISGCTQSLDRFTIKFDNNEPVIFGLIPFKLIFILYCLCYCISVYNSLTELYYLDESFDLNTKEVSIIALSR